MNWAATKEILNFARKMPAGATVLYMIAVTVFLAWAHFYGHAKSDELAKVKKDIVSLQDDVSTIKDDGQKARREQLEGQMFQARVDQCKALNDELKRLYASRVASLEVKYIEAGGKDYRLPTCADL
jgi:dihydroxyacetone kinase